jgi:hypothetical protein
MFFVLASPPLSSPVPLDLWHYVIAGLVDLHHLGLLFCSPILARIGCEEHLQKGVDGRMALNIFHGTPACWAGIWVRWWRMGMRSLSILMREPFLQTRAAEGVEAVDQGARLVEDLGTDEADEFFL